MAQVVLLSSHCLAPSTQAVFPFLDLLFPKHSTHPDFSFQIYQPFTFKNDSMPWRRMETECLRCLSWHRIWIISAEIYKLTDTEIHPCLCLGVHVSIFASDKEFQKNIDTPFACRFLEPPCPGLLLLLRLNTTMSKSKLGKERGYFTTKGNRDLGGMLFTAFLSTAIWTCFLIQPRTSCPGLALPRVGPAHSGLNVPLSRPSVHH